MKKIDIYSTYDQEEAFRIAKLLKENDIHVVIEESPEGLQAYAPAMIQYFLKVELSDSKRANGLIDDLG
jgi:alpha-galactosidase